MRNKLIVDDLDPDTAQLGKQGHSDDFNHSWSRWVHASFLAIS